MIRRASLTAAASSLLIGGCALLGSDAPAPVEPRSPGKDAVSPAPTSRAPVVKPPAGTKRGGGYYLDDGPGDAPPPDLAKIPDAVPVDAPPHRFANKPYNVFGRDYVPLAQDAPYRARGVASWYGRKFHGQKTSSGEPYDMYGMTAAHPTLPIPSYVRVTNPANGNSVVLRVNDRGPFHSDRLIDLSYTAAWKLGYINEGSTLVEVERISVDTPVTVATARNDNQPPVTVVTKTSQPLPAQRDESGTYLQLGAFSTRDNAESFLAHLGRELAREPLPGNPNESMDSKLVIRSAGLWHRVQLGPWSSPEAARAAADNLARLVGSPPMLVTR